MPRCLAPLLLLAAFAAPARGFDVPPASGAPLPQQEVRARWARSACAASTTPSARKGPARTELIIVLKSLREMALCARGELLAHYRVALGPNPLGHKRRRGDGRTPEGFYRVTMKQDFYHRSLRLSYPNEDDRRRAREDGVDPGGGVLIHGLSDSKEGLGELHVLRDWTEGCIAVTNEEIDEVDRLTPVGTVVEIRP
ncbi:MAG: L,D-transpeptidase family protein [Elusimicrobiota bacterium]|jgi:murein L,D-transpeptidase YafK